MSVISEEMQKNIAKFNRDSEDIINGVAKIIEGKDHGAAIECLAIILTNFIGRVENKEQRDKIINNLIDNLKKYLDK